MTALKIYLRSLQILWHEKFTATSLLISGIALAAIQLLEPLLFGRFIDSLNQAQQGSFEYLIMWAVLGGVSVVVSVYLAIMADRLAHRQRLTMMGQVFERAIALPISFHSQQGTGRVIRSILAGTDHLFGLWLAFLREHLPSFVGVIVLVPTAISMDWRMAVLLFALAAVYVLGSSVILRKTQGGQAAVESFHQDVFGRVGDVIGNVSVVQSFTRLVEEKQELQNLMSRLLSAQYPVLTWWGILNVITRLSATLTMVSLLSLGLWLIRRGEMTVGQVVAFTGFAGILIAKLDQISAFVTRLISQAPVLKTFFELMDKESGPSETQGSHDLVRAKGEVVFDHVTYTYAGRQSGVFDIHLSVSPGQTVAFVGASGSGKTTTIALLQRFFDPQSGQILIDGHSIREFTLSSLRQNIATVFQDAGLFNRSIAENIRIGRPSATDAEVEEAARKAKAENFILQKPGGYQFMIGERGSALSGGERQRLAIARAILKDAPILVFDEATSALDNETERQIHESLFELGKNKTTFIIAHRLSTIAAADLILVYDHGRIVERGSFQQLKDQNGVFARLLRAGEFTTRDRKQEPESLGV